MSFGIAQLWRRVSKSRIGVATIWTTGAFALGQFIRIAGNLILTRLLAPEMFGVMAIVLTIQTTLGLMSDLGVRTVLVQSKQGDDPNFLNTAWTLEILRGAALSLICILLAWGLQFSNQVGWLPADSTWTASELPLVLAITSLGQFISATASTNLATAQRHLQAKQLALLEIFTQAIGLVILVILGLIFRSIWALVLGGLLSSIIATILSHTWFPGIRNRLTWDGKAVRETISIGRWILMSSGMHVLSTNIDKYILATYFSAQQMGLYSIAIGLVMMVEQVGSRVMTAIALPALSEAARENPEKLRGTLIKIRIPIDVGFLLVAGSLFAAGPRIVEILYDYRYYSAGPILQILSFGLFFSRFGTLNMAFVAMGNAKSMAMVSTIKLASGTILMILLHSLYGITGLLVAVAIHPLPSVLYMLAQGSKRGLNNWKYEIAVLPALPVGYFLGNLAVGFINIITG